MHHLLFLQITEPSLPARTAAFLGSYWPILLPTVLGFVAVYLLLPGARRTPPVWSAVAGAVALLSAVVFLIHATGPWPEALLFYGFAGVAVLSGSLMITQSNPVFAALSFALVILSSCGLFLLQGAPFLMAATVIIYAGAIVVTFLFVIMLAQQQGYSSADLRSREPFLGALSGFVLMATILCTVQRAMATPELDQAIRQLRSVSAAQAPEEANSVLGTPPAPGTPEPRKTLPLVDTARRYLPADDDQLTDALFRIESAWIKLQQDKQQLEPLKKDAQTVLKKLEAVQLAHGSLAQGHVPGKELKPGVLPQRNVEGLGRLLFTDLLVPVELAGVLLLVATIGAIVIAGRHTETLR
jgi:NADH:ubiquinone oxidoreductase subunit 6 (subunit J)